MMATTLNAAALDRAPGLDEMEIDVDLCALIKQGFDA
jgi:hypothetical protein